MQLLKAENFIIDLLESKLSPSLYYHNISHTRDVFNAVIKIAHDEKVTDERELLMLKTAALFHDCGFINVYKGHEEEGCKIAREALPAYEYSTEEIDFICELILATRTPQNPQTHLQKILCDADLDYLGGDNFEEIGNNLYRERLERGLATDEKEWNKAQIKFLESYHFWTDSAISKNEGKRKLHLKNLKIKTGLIER